MCKGEGVGAVATHQECVSERVVVALVVRSIPGRTMLDSEMKHEYIVCMYRMQTIITVIEFR